MLCDRPIVECLSVKNGCPTSISQRDFVRPPINIGDSDVIKFSPIEQHYFESHA